MEKKPLPAGFRSEVPRMADLPPPAAYRELHPAILELPAPTAKSRFFERKRVVIGLGMAIVFHLSIALAWWLSPPLRLKVGYAPERWVPVLSVPPRASPPQTQPVPEPVPAPMPVKAKTKARKSRATAIPSQ